MSWGYKITLLYCSFAVLILGMVFASIKYNTIHLVTKDYYQQEVYYNEKAQKISNTRSLEAVVEIDYQFAEQQILLSFPKKAGIKGNIKLYRPSNSKKDQDFVIRLNQGQQVLDVSNLTRGQWKVQVDWKAEGKAYYQDKMVIL